MDDRVDEWSPFEGGRSMGLVGSEAGVIVLDDELADGARITIERNCQSAPYAITCGVYGWMVHTRFFSSETEARSECVKMKVALVRLVRTLTADDRDAAGAACEEFTTLFPT